MRFSALTISSLLFLSFIVGGQAEQCGIQAGGALCPNGLCCSEYGWCGSTHDYCNEKCQSQCDGGDSGGGDLESIIPRATFEAMLKYRDDVRCHAPGFYTYDAFIFAAKAFPNFGTTGDTETRKREIAAFFGQTSHETTRGWADAPDGPYAWGYCYKRKVDQSHTRCDGSVAYPCAPGEKYFGRGPMQLT
ncbi:Chitinase [Quillaja saponaria]|uniref:chitinase n=1 Tax=Quillaja saponaria TaxID=32244 RepID=A0AAD7VK52_QUISA|nr:Chitinase [Quillaja saponaria]